jgi:hypothetical protein
MEHTEFKDGVPRVEPGVALPADHLVTVVLLGQQPKDRKAGTYYDMAGLNIGNQ